MCRGDGLNLYAYCSNNPVSYYDPSGYARCNKGGAVYDFDNLVIVSPKMNQTILDTSYHFGKKGASLKGR